MQTVFMDIDSALELIILCVILNYSDIQSFDINNYWSCFLTIFMKTKTWYLFEVSNKSYFYMNYVKIEININ